MNKRTPSFGDRSKRKPSIWSIGGSVFAMFFGAGNIVFPLVLGCRHHTHPWIACFGMIITAVCVPLLGLFSILLYSGDYQKLFSSIGKTPGTILVIAILCLIGPFGGLPRSIAISHSTLASLSDTKTIFLPNLPIFSFICCLLIYVFSCKLSKLIQWLGSVFFPIMLAILLWIIFKGLTTPAHLNLSPSFSAEQSWLAGIVEGFNTMDLLASFFFCSIVLISIQQRLAHENAVDETPLDFQKINKKDKRTLMLAFVLAGALLACIYLGFTLCASRHASILANVSKGQILGRISTVLLGSSSLLTGICVFIACLTTEIALAGIIADFLARVISSKHMTYSNAVIFTLVPSYFVSILNFENISYLLLPILQLSYPALIALSCGTIAQKLWHFRHVQALFYLTFAFTIISRLIS
ncbi:Branched-chain amino acid transport system 2 carrier protein [Chlamydia avium]|uniref:Branched-chain amino acid transport system II carrier protein n=2 Tax=Chlamydia avium TaxID=1457141 RepID=W8JMN9_9CHLA|nr:branched-chain amino acid transport system II carrier protein [Chlamydia avium]AHK63564.1 Branched-chain amino acid transport system II carrier protein [Chlamydia avium 10DC88]EPP36145.1 branched-chain amino acid transport system II carrier protein [Chlamydia psittaci 10_743_SC13]EPP38897.1 branched-chain amino acid transport system II carrier protein [Chlamydia avium]VVT43152.1 Branched-chain amino acid transport system 2 carrier protein [Chlamydia avium]